MEKHNFSWVNQLIISMAIFNSKLLFYQRLRPQVACTLNLCQAPQQSRVLLMVPSTRTRLWLQHLRPLEIWYIIIYTYTCVCVYIYIRVCIYIYIYLYTHSCICIYIYIYTFVYVYIYIHTFVYVYIYITYIRAYISIYTYIILLHV